VEHAGKLRSGEYLRPSATTQVSCVHDCDDGSYGFQNARAPIAVGVCKMVSGWALLPGWVAADVERKSLKSALRCFKTRGSNSASDAGETTSRIISELHALFLLRSFQDGASGRRTCVESSARVLARVRRSQDRCRAVAGSRRRLHHKSSSATMNRLRTTSHTDSDAIPSGKSV
jgi:hypothetical protein